jgi:outer membrane protein TolC
MRATSRPFWIASLCCVLWPAVPAAAEVVTLKALEQLALQNRPALAAGSARTRAAHAEIERVEGAYYPALSLEAQSSLSPGRELVEVDEDVVVQGARTIGNSEAFAPRLRNELDLELRSNLYDFGRTSAAIDAGRAQHASAQAEEEAARTAIVLAVRAAYLGWLGQSELLAIAEQTAADAERSSLRVHALIAEGARPQAELSVARADEMLAKLELERARGAQRAARLALEHAVGGKLAKNAEPDRALLEASAAAPAAGGDDAALRALALKQRAARADARRIDRADAPVLGGVLAAGVRQQGEDVFPNYAVGLSFSLPLLDGGISAAAAAAARARADALAADLEAERTRRRDARERAALDRENARSQLATATALLEVATQRAHEVEQGYELGALGIEPVAQARALLRRAQTEMLHAKLAYAEAELRLSSR